MEFIAETYTPQSPWRDIPILKVKKRIQSVNCIFERHAYPSGGFLWLLNATRRVKKNTGRKIEMVTIAIDGNSLWGQADGYKQLRSGELPDYKIFEHVFYDFCLDGESKLREFL